MRTGLFLPIANKTALFLFNSPKYSKGTIRHELIHYFQHYFQYGLYKINFDKCFDYSKFDHLLLNKREIDYLFSVKECIPHIETYIFHVNKLDSPKEFFNESLDYFEKHKFDKDILECEYIRKIVRDWD
jgi:hypothetical protein